ncbi:AF211538_1Avr9 Cf-9 rapidly elicited 180, partial [Olea europaea subsp. europaea]
MMKKPSKFLFFFKRLNKTASKGEGGDVGNSSGASRWKFKSSTGLRWKRRFSLHLWFVDDILFKIVSIFEAIILVATLCFFFLCCGCHL